MIAMATRVGKHFDDLVHAFGGNELPAVSRVTELAARLASTFHATPPFPLASREAVG